MTIHETIQILERMLDPDPWEVWELEDKVKEALETAIETLENQGVQDTGQISEGW